MADHAAAGAGGGEIDRATAERAAATKELLEAK
jgi:hypothetical protein